MDRLYLYKNYGLFYLFYIVLPILKTTKYTFLVEIQKVFLSLQNQEKREKALLASNLSGLS